MDRMVTFVVGDNVRPVVLMGFQAIAFLLIGLALQ